MKAAVYHRNGPPEVLQYEEVPDPEVAPGGVVIRVEAVSIEGGDTLNRLGGPLLSEPHIVGYQAAGTIVEVADDVTDRAVGDRVVATSSHGSHAELFAVSARTTWKVPEGADIAAAACVPVAFGTAHDCLFEFGRLTDGETVLIQAGAGASAWPRSSWPSGPAPPSSRPRRPSPGSSRSPSSAWTTPWTTPAAVGWTRCGPSPTAGAG